MRYVDADQELEQRKNVVRQASQQLRELEQQSEALVAMLDQVDLTALSAEIDTAAGNEATVGREAWVDLRAHKDAIMESHAATRAEAAALRDTIRGR